MDDWLRLRSDIQKRITDANLLEVESATKYFSELRKCLLDASDNRYLETKQNLVYNQLQMKKPNKGDSIWIIYGGTSRDPKNFNRDKALPHFERKDGGWFDFSLSVDERTKPAQITFYTFELRFPVTHRIEFIKFDLNPPDHDNDKRDIRSHIHPGHDDLMIHSPPMNPLEILHLFLYDLYLTDKPRAR
jgi:hypothetical protein